MATNYKWSDLTTGDRARAMRSANHLLPAWVSLVVVVLIGWQLAKLLWLLMPGPAAGSQVAVPVMSNGAAAGSPAASNTSIIANAHIFGEADKAAAAPVPVQTQEVLTETNLSNLKLKGTMASAVPQYSIAIIADGNKDEKIYAVGDPVSAGASLHAVYADRVVLNERGALTNLSLPREFTENNASAYNRSMSVQQMPDESIDNDQSIQAVVAQNVTQLADVIRPTPYFVNGEQQGYRVYPGRNRAQFAELGLRPGDLIKDIDGQSLSDPAQAMQIFQSLGTASQVSVTVERDGTPETIVLRTDQLDLGKETTQ
jgi:general secretion pathway protein C